MCGIFAYQGEKTDVANLIFSGLKSLEYRGYDSWGVLVKKLNGDFYLKRQLGKITDEKLPIIISTEGFGHTRWATHGGVLEKNTHPHFDCQKQIFVVHNGIIENFNQLKQELIKKGHIFTSETDTEVVPHLAEELRKKTNDRLKIIKEIIKKIQGLNAVILYFLNDSEFYAFKNSSPIVVGKNNDGIFLASDASALAPYTNKVYFLDDGEILVIKEKNLSLFDKNGKPKKINFINLNYKVEDTLLGGYKHFMIKEINEQPKVLKTIVDTQEQNLKKAANLIKKSYGSYFIGCGSAYYASLTGTYFFSKIAKRHINAAVASEFSYLVDFLKETSLVIPLSQSGETIDVISSIKKAKEKKAKILALTNVLESTLYRLADEKLLLLAGPEKCVLATKSFTAKLAFLYLLAHILNGTFKKGQENLKKAIKEVEKIINEREKIKKLASFLKNKEHIFILGRGVSYPVALESALKIKESSYIHAEGFPAGELKHGVIALIEKETPVIVYNPIDETYEDTLSSAYEVSARGAYVIGISSKNNPVYHQFFQIEDCADATTIPNVVFAQLLGYYMTLARGLDPDKPRNLAKSVTVK